jgi:hypothetical protein
MNAMNITGNQGETGCLGLRKLHGCHAGADFSADFAARSRATPVSPLAAAHRRRTNAFNPPPEADVDNTI